MRIVLGLLCLLSAGVCAMRATGAWPQAHFPESLIGLWWVSAAIAAGAGLYVLIRGI